MNKAVILLATVKKEGQSNTQVLCDFLAERMMAKGVECELIRLVDHKILPGTYSDMGRGDAWPKILKKIVDAPIVIFATPVWWGGHSSEMQRVIERLDEIHDEILEGKPSKLKGKVAGIVVTGDSDGAEHICGNLANFFNAIGLLLPPMATLTVLSQKQAKGEKTSRADLLKFYKKDYSKTAVEMVNQILRYVETA